MIEMATIQAKYRALRRRLDESTLRLWAAAEARSLGRGGISAVAKTAGISRTTIHAGLAELKKAVAEPAAKGQARARYAVREPVERNYRPGTIYK